MNCLVNYNHQYVINFWHQLSNNIIDISKCKCCDQINNYLLLKNNMSGDYKKFLIKPLNEPIVSAYNNELNEIMNKIINIIATNENKAIIQNIRFYDFYAGLYQLYKDLKLLDSINDGYIFFDENRFEEKYFYYGAIIMVASVFSLNLVENKIEFSFVDIYQNNPLILFYLCCYVFFDSLLDSPDIDKDTKKSVVSYIDHMFKTGNKLSNYDNVEKKYITTVNNIFSILLNYDINEYPYLYESMYKIFLIEVKSSKYQTFIDKTDVKDQNVILQMSMIKGRETLLSSWQIFNITTDFRSCNELLYLADHGGYVFQLLDDLDDL